MITLPVNDAQELWHDLLTSAQGTMPTEVATAPRYRALAQELRQCKGSKEYVELTPELVEIASKFGYIG